MKREHAATTIAASLLALAACGERVDVGGPLVPDAMAEAAPMLTTEAGHASDVLPSDVLPSDATVGCCVAGESYGATCQGCCTGLVRVTSDVRVTCELPYRKVLLVMETSGSLVVTDPTKYRVGAVTYLVQAYQAETNGPTTSLGVLTFSSSIAEVTNGFTATPDLTAIDQQVTLEDDTCDYDGALRAAYEMLSDDMLSLSAAERAQTSYAVVFFADGLPDPICSASTTPCGSQLTCNPHTHCVPTTTVGADGGDQEAYACASDEDVCIVPKSEWASSFNPPVPSSLYPALAVDESYNTTPQLVADVSRIMQLKVLDQVGALSVSTIFLFSKASLSSSLAAPFDLDEPAPKALLQAMAQAGNGSFQELTPSQLTFLSTPSLE